MYEPFAFHRVGYQNSDWFICMHKDINLLVSRCTTLRWESMCIEIIVIQSTHTHSKPHPTSPVPNSQTMQKFINGKNLNFQKKRTVTSVYFSKAKVDLSACFEYALSTKVWTIKIASSLISIKYNQSFPNESGLICDLLQSDALTGL